MIGGGQGSFIGAVHRIAANLDGQIELVSGCFSSKAENSIATGIMLGISKDRVYTSYEEMILTESKKSKEEKLDFISIVTPNYLHFKPAQLALQNGINVIIDKPITFNYEECMELKKLVDKTSLLLAITHTYSGYPMIKEAKDFVSNGSLGKIRKVYVEYPQGWLSKPLEKESQKQASWRTDPTKSGKGGSLGDIGTHAFHLLEYVSGHKTTDICAHVQAVVENRLLDDDVMILLKLENGVSGMLHATQVAAGEENNMKLRIYGEKGGLEWNHSDPNSLWIKWLDKPAQLYRAGTEYLSDSAKNNSRLPAGHPEGFIEAFANIYKNFAESIRNGKISNDIPNVDDGLRGMYFIDKALESSKSKDKWIKF